MGEVRGKIIRVLSPTQVIVNKGKVDGVTQRANFQVLADPEQIVDPETGEKLGSVVIIKARLEAIQVFDKFTIAAVPANYDFSGVFGEFFGQRGKEQSKGGSSGSLVPPVSYPPLNIDDTQVQPWKALSDEKIRVGDAVQYKVADVTDEDLESQDPEDLEAEGTGG